MMGGDAYKERGYILMLEATPKAADVLIALLNSKSERIRLDAAEALLNLAIAYERLDIARRASRMGEEWRE
jgi:HEAT repeat protein